MSFAAHVWSSGVAPIANVYEYAVLNRMADEVDDSGEGCYIGTPTIARDVMADERTVRRTIDALLERKLIGLGDQRRALGIRADRRPTVYDLLIPAECFADLNRTNQRRADRGLPPITPENRPVQDPPPEDARRSKRADAGKKRSKKVGDSEQEQAQLDEEAARADQPKPDDLTDSHAVTGGQSVTPSATGGLPVRHGVTTSPPRGDYQSGDPVFDPGSSDPEKTPPTPRSAEPAASAAVEAVTGGDSSPAENPSPGPEPRTGLDALVDELTTKAGHWPASTTRQVLVQLAAAGRAPDEIARVARECATGVHGVTGSPRRLLTWWPTAPTPAPEPEWARGPVKYLDPGTPRCHKHPTEPESSCVPCKTTGFLDPADLQAAVGERLPAAEARRLARENAAAAKTRRAAHRPRTPAPPPPAGGPDPTPMGALFGAFAQAVGGRS